MTELAITQDGQLVASASQRHGDLMLWNLVSGLPMMKAWGDRFFKVTPNSNLFSDWLEHVIRSLDIPTRDLAWIDCLRRNAGI